MSAKSAACRIFALLCYFHWTAVPLHFLASAFATQTTILGRSIRPTTSASVAQMSWKIYATPNTGNNAGGDDEPARLRRQAQQLRDEIRAMEEKLAPQRAIRQASSGDPSKQLSEEGLEEGEMSLKGKTVMVVGANGRLGSMVCRYLLRNNPLTKVVAAVHYVGEASTRGYGRLSYEVGAEDGKGSINPAWDSEDRNAYFEFTEEMRSYNLQNLRVVEVELLDPVQCMTITEDVDCVIWCATDFNGNTPRAISGLNAAFLFRAVADPTKGRVEIEGLRNILGGLKNSKQSRRWNRDRVAASPGVEPYGTYEGSASTGTQSTLLDRPSDPISFVLVSASESAFGDFETPFGSFKGLKRDGERIATEEFPSLSTCILRMSRYEDNFVGEDLEIMKDNKEWTVSAEGETEAAENARRRINRRDAARAAVDALTDESLKGKIAEVWTAVR